MYHSHVISNTTNPVQNNEYEIPINGTETSKEKIMDKLQFLNCMCHIGDPAVRKEVNITYEMKDAG